MWDRSRCSVAGTLAVVGEKWSLLVLREAFLGVRRFADFQRVLGAPKAVLTHRLATLVDQLGEREADIIRSRFGLLDGRTHKLADIGARHGISAERVRQLEREALARLRVIADPDLAA